MHRRIFVPLFLSIALVAACKKKPVDDAMADPGPGKAETTPAPKAEVPEHVQQIMKNFERVYFEFDSASLDGDSRVALDENAALLAQYAEVKVEVQGHADERGTTDYNLALGQKRADAVVAYLGAKGISPSRVKSVSYGEERPLDMSTSEHAWAKNRRAEFIVTWKADAPVQGTSG